MGDRTGKEKINPALKRLVRPTEGLKVDPENARKHTDDQLDRIARSLATFSQQKPIVVLLDGTVVAGNGLFLAATKLLKWTRIAAVKLTAKTGAAYRAFAIADNRAAELAEWHDPVLTDVLKEIQKGDVGIEAAGFSQAEFELVMRRAEDLLPATDAKDGEGIPEEKPPAWSANVRMVQLVLTNEGYEAFVKDVKKLAPKYGKSTITDVVYEAMRRAAAD